LLVERHTPAAVADIAAFASAAYASLRYGDVDATLRHLRSYAIAAICYATVAVAARHADSYARRCYEPVCLFAAIMPPCDTPERLRLLIRCRHTLLPLLLRFATPRAFYTLMPPPYATSLRRICSLLIYTSICFVAAATRHADTIC